MQTNVQNIYFVVDWSCNGKLFYKVESVATNLDFAHVIHKDEELAKKNGWKAGSWRLCNGRKQAEEQVRNNNADAKMTDRYEVPIFMKSGKNRR